MRLFKPVYALAAVLLLEAAPSLGQNDIIRSTGGGNETGAIIRVTDDNAKYVVTNVFETGSTTQRDIIVTQYASDGSITWRKKYGQSNFDEAAVSVDVDIDRNFIMLCNVGNTNGLAGNSNYIQVFQIHGSTGNMLRLHERRSPVANRNLMGAKIIAKPNGNQHYWVFTNVYDGFNFSSAYIYELSRFWFPASTTGRTHQITPAVGNRLAIYDAVVLNDVDAYICGMNNNEGFIAKLRLGSTPLITIRSLDSHPTQNSATDRIVVYNNALLQRRFAVAMTGVNDNLAYAILDTNLNVLDTIGINITPEVGERTSSLYFNAGTLYATGIVPSRKQGFAISLGTASDVLSVNWVETPVLFTQPNSSNTFRSDLFNGRLYFTTNAHSGNSSDHDVFWGSRALTAGSSNCFETVTWSDINRTAGNPVNTAFINTIPPDTINKTNPTPANVALTDIAACYSCTYKANEATFIGSTSILGAVTWGLNNQGTKYQVSGSVIVPAGTRLDITNCDVSFGPEAEIVVQEGGILRANNSVFRTCDPRTSWKGISFINKAEGIIEECLFKNAQVALNVNGTAAATHTNNLRVTNNTFTNCQTAVSFRGVSNDNASLNGNTFNLDNTIVTFPGTAPVTPGTGNAPHIGVLIQNCPGKLEIVQNDFSYNSTSTLTKTLYGIYLSLVANEMLAAQPVNISNNTFTNCYTGITFQSGKGEIINNTFTVNAGGGIFDYQIVLRTCTLGTALVSMNRIAASPSKLCNGGIYAENGTNSVISSNIIEGTENGIYVTGYIGIRVFSNEIKFARIHGIYTSNLATSTVKCNVIDMKLYPYAIGISYFQTITSINSVEIRGNCIYNTYTAMYLNSNASRVLPVIRNNYFYNYKENGIHNVNFTGNIGTTGSGTDQGRNTFLSNNYNAGSPGFDINSNVNINSSGNYNVNNITGTVSLYDIDLENTNSACANFFFGLNPNMQLLEEDACDAAYSGGGNPLEMVIWKNNQPQLNEEYFRNLDGNTLSNDRLVIYVDAVDFINGQSPGLKNTYMNMLAQYEQNASVLGFVKAYEKMVGGDYASAEQLLNSVSIENSFMQEMKTEFMIYLRHGLKQISDEELVAQLNTISPSYTNMYSAAYARVSPVTPGYDFKIIPMLPVVMNVSERMINSGQASMSIVPNPANEAIQVHCNTGGKKAEQVQVINLLGQVIMQMDAGFNADNFRLETSGLAPGNYLLSTTMEDGSRLTSKFTVSR